MSSLKCDRWLWSNLERAVRPRSAPLVETDLQAVLLVARWPGRHLPARARAPCGPTGPTGLTGVNGLAAGGGRAGLLGAVA